MCRLYYLPIGAVVVAAGCQSFAATNERSDAGTSPDAQVNVTGDAAASTSDAAPPTTETDSPYATLVRETSPLAYWRLGEGEGSTIAVDTMTDTHVGPYHHGQYISPVLLDRTGAVRGSRAIQPANGGVEIGDFFSFDDHAAFSFEAWIRFNGVPKESGNYTEEYLISKYDAPNERGWHVFVSSSNTVGMNVNQGHGVIAELFATLTPSPSFRHIVAAYDGTTNARIYVDGKEENSATFDRNLPVTNISLRLGFAEGGRGSFQGVLDEVALYNRVLTAAEIAKHYSVGIAP